MALETWRADTEGGPGSELVWDKIVYLASKAVQTTADHGMYRSCTTTQTTMHFRFYLHTHKKIVANDSLLHPPLVNIALIL